MSVGHIDIVDNVVNKMMSSTRQITRGLYRVYKKKCPKYKIASKSGIWKITDINSNQQLIKGLQVGISVNFVFICSIL